jgi:glycerate kinase
VGGVADLAAELGIPALAVVGRCFDGTDDRIETISLVEAFGVKRSMTETTRCITEAVTARLRRNHS